MLTWAIVYLLKNNVRLPGVFLGGAMFGDVIMITAIVEAMR